MYSLVKLLSYRSLELNNQNLMGCFMSKYYGWPKHIRSMVDEIVEREDQNWLDNLSDDYNYLMIGNDSDTDQVLKNFVSNYSSPSIGKVKNDDLTGEELRVLLGDDLLLELIRACSAAEPSDYYVKWNEIASLTIGEQEYQIDLGYYPELSRALKAEGIDAGESFFAFGSPCDRLIMRLDAKAFLKAANKELKTLKRRSKLQLVRA